jgi:hypothetical protein
MEEKRKEKNNKKKEIEKKEKNAVQPRASRPCGAMLRHFVTKAMHMNPDALQPPQRDASPFCHRRDTYGSQLEARCN